MRPVTAMCAGSFVAALVPALYGSATSNVFGEGLAGLAAGSLIFFFYSAMVTVLVGVPVFLLALRFRVARWWVAIAAGGAIGFVVAIVIKPTAQIAEVLPFICVGEVSALAFWTIWSRARTVDNRWPQSMSDL